MWADPDIRRQPSLAWQGVYLLDDHEVVRRGLRQLMESVGLSIAGESGSAREAVRRIPALRPKLAILDDDLPDGSGTEVCRAIAAAEPRTRCVLMTADADEGVLIDSILAGAWGCLSKQDDNGEQLRLIHRALAGDTAYSGRFRPALPDRPDERLLKLTKQEVAAAIGLGKGQSNRQISQEMLIAEQTVKNTVSSVLTKLGLARRTQAAVLVTSALGQLEAAASGGYRFNRFPDLIAEATAALLNCTTEARTVPPTNAVRATDAVRLADALSAVWPGRTGPQPLPSWP
jgi:DNA-binding NarL/FixJ family response regulator